MEETKNSQSKLSRFYCENNFCNNSGTHYCSEHSQALCHDCAADLHQSCKRNKIPDSKSVTESLDAAKLLLTSIQETYGHLKVNFDINLAEEFSMYSEILAKIDENLYQCINNHKPYELCLVMEEIHKFQQKFSESNLSTEFTKLKRNIKQTSYKNLDRGSDGSKLINYSDREFNIIQKPQIKRTNQLSEKITCANIDISNKSNSKICTSGLKVMDNKNNLDCNVTNIETIRENIMQNEKKIREQEYNIQSIVFTRIYERRMNKKIWNVSDFEIRISLEDEEQKNLLKDIVASKIRLPNLDCIQIDKVSDFDTDLVSFLTDSIPAKLERFWINYYQIEDIPIKAEFYVSSLLKAVSAVTEKVLIYLFEFSAVELQSIVKAACNAKQIVIRRCSVHCSTTLDFGETTKYKTNFLSFESCGYSGYDQVTTDWKTDPSCFSNIVDAIKNSGLRHSLTKLDISDNQTLNEGVVRKLLNANGMTNISVIYSEPEEELPICEIWDY